MKEEDYYCLDIQFRNVDLDQYFPGSKPCHATHHAHLYLRKDEVELQVLYEPDTLFSTKLGSWLMTIDPVKFGSYLKVSNESQNPSLQSVDFSDSGLTVSKHEVGSNVIHIGLNSVKLYWDPHPNRLNSGDFYLQGVGFEVVSHFYIPMSPLSLYRSDGKFKISRREGMDRFYTLGQSEYRPEFEFRWNDCVPNHETTITKVPKIYFTYAENTTEGECIQYAEVVRQVVSFYFHINIEYRISKIYLKKHTIEIRKIPTRSPSLKAGSLFHFNHLWDFDQFLGEKWPEQAMKNIDTLTKVIELFNQSRLVEHSSGFLMRYNIIEICMSGKKLKDQKFTEILCQTQVEQRYKAALDILLTTVDEKEQGAFKERWRSVKNKLTYKSESTYKRMESFLKSQHLPLSDFPIGLKQLIEMRNQLTHGRMGKVDPAALKRANALLYKLTAALILNTLGLTDWQLDLQSK